MSTKTLYAFYDLAVNPCSFDFIEFLNSAEIRRIRSKLTNIKLILVHGPANKYRGDAHRSQEINDNFFHNVMLPAISLIPQISSFIWTARDDINLGKINIYQIFPRSYNPQKPPHEYFAMETTTAMVRGDQPAFFIAPEYAKKMAKQFIDEKLKKQPFITITMREDDRMDPNNKRSMNIDVWQDVFIKLKSLKITPVIIRDTSNAFLKPLFKNTIEIPTASVSLHFRLALYEYALLNFTKSNGPGMMLLGSTANSIYFLVKDDNVLCISKNWFLTHFGMVENSHFPMTTHNKETIWEEENTDLIIDKIKKAHELDALKYKLRTFNSIENLKSSMAIALNQLVKNTNYSILDEDHQLLARLMAFNQKYHIFSNILDQLAAIKGDVISEESFNALYQHYQKNSS